MFVDSHCHLCFGDLEARCNEVLSHARKVNVGRFVAVATSRGEFAKVRALASAEPDVFCTIGIHPEEAEKPGEIIKAEELASIATSDPKIVGIGETGLDYYYDERPRDAQERNFREHIRACIASELPLVIHTRSAEADTLRILQEEIKGNEGKLTGVFHCYSSNRELAEAGLAMGFFFSFSGILTFKKAENVREIAQIVPLDKVLIETDSPYLAPEPYRGRPCEPAYVVHTAARLAAVKGVDVATIERATTENFFRLFKKAS